MTEETNLKDSIKARIGRQEMVLLYFYNDNCQPCLALRPKLESMLRNYPEVDLIFVNSATEPGLNASFHVFTNPLIILFVQGRESLRFSKYVSVDQIKQAISRPYGLIFS